jgi:PAS domain S-box-containing protein
MTTTILVIDDSEDDQRLYQRAFKDFELSFNLVMTSSAEAAFARIADVSPDLILLDYNLPDMDGLSVMKRLADYSDTPIPIVMLTGEGSTALAVEVMKRGADDYLVKDTEGRYLRLLPGVVERVLTSYAQRKHIQQLRRETEVLLHRNHALMQNSMDGIHVMDIQGNLVEANDAFCDMLGYTRKEMVGLNVADWDMQWSMEELQESFKELIGKSARIETVHRRKDRALISVEISCSGMEIEGQNLIFASSRDITERKKTAEALLKSEANLRAVLDNSPYLSWLKDTEGRYITINKVYADYLRLEDIRQAIGKTDLDLQPEELAKKYRADDAEVMAARQQKQIEESAFDGKNTYWVETYKTPIMDAHGNVLGTVGFAKDISERKNIQLKTEMLLRRNMALMRTSMDGIHVLDTRGNLVDFNDAFCHMLGYSREEMVGFNVADWSAEFSVEASRVRFNNQLGQSVMMETLCRRKDGALLNVEISVAHEEIDGQGLLFCSSRDITERKKAEEELRLANETGRKRADELAQQFGYLLQNSFNEIYLFDANSMKFILTSEGAENNLGYSDEELNQLTPLDLKPSFTRESFEELIAPLRSGEQQSLFFETFHRRKDGTTYPVDVRLQLMRVESPMFLAVIQDITERKRAEENLRLHSNILNSMNEGVFLVRASDGIIVYANPQLERMFGYETGELSGKHVSIVNAPGENSQEEVAEAIMCALIQTGAWNGEVCNIRKDGTTFWCRASVSTFMHSRFGNVWLAVHEDITERKMAEQNQIKLNRALTLLSECDTLVIHAKNEQQLLEETCQLVVVTGGYMMAWVGIAENDEVKTVRPIAQSGYEDGYLDRIKVTWSDTEFGQGPTGTAIRTGAVVITQDCQTTPRMAPWREALTKRGYQSSIALPLVRNNRVFAALTIYSAEPRAFSNEEAAFLEELANNFSFGIETLRTRKAHVRAEQESRELTRHLQTVREEEKASFAREIHDELGGTLAALKMDAHWLAGKLEEKKEMMPLQECAKSMIGLLDTAVISMRRIITDLRPTLLDDLGLMEAFKWQSVQFQKRTGIECRVACTGDEDCEDMLDKMQSINLFRILQESLTNIARHSGATRVDVKLRRDDKEIVLTISDNGCGLPEGHTIASTSYGIRGMRERVAQLSGKIIMDTPSGGGFSVKVILPLPAGNEK